MNIYLGITTNFNNNGLGFLVDCISAKVTNAKNGVYELNIEYPRNTNMEEYLIVGNIIKCNVGDNNYQLFRIKNVDKSFNPIKIYAQHIFYDLLDNYIEDAYPQNLNCEAFGNWILSKTNFSTNFEVFSDITGVKTARYVDKNPVQCFLGSEENSVINLFNCEIERDNFNIHFKSQIGYDNGIKLIIGKNITGITIKIDISSLYTKIKPVGYNGLTLPETFINSPLINEWPTPKIYKYNFDSIKYDPNDPEAYQNEEEAYSALRSATNDLFANGIDKPQINIKIDWVELSKTTEYYTKYSNIEKVGLGDTVRANILGIDYTTRVIKTVYNVLNDRIESYELGTEQASYASSINSITNSVNEINPTEILSQAQQNATNQITAAMGGYVLKTNNELFIMDTDNPNTATKVWRWNLNGLGYSSNGIDGPYETAITQDGAIVADFITTGKINTDVIEGYNQLVLKVSEIQDLTNEVNNDYSIELINAIEGNLLSLKIHGEMSLLYPSNDLYPNDDLYPLDSYLIIQYEDNSQVKIRLPLNYLRYLSESVYDEFIIESNQCRIVRRVGEGTDGTLYALDSEVIEELGEIFIDIKNGTNKIWLESFYDKPLSYYAKYATINDYTDVLATKVELNSSIKQTKDEINLEVSKKVDENEVVSTINQSAEQITLTGNRLVVNATNFSLTAEGKATMNDAVINGGELHLQNGAKVTGDNGLITNLMFRSDGNYGSYSVLGYGSYYEVGGAPTSFKNNLYLDIDIPSNFTIESAILTLFVTSAKWSNSSGSGYTNGSPRNLKVYRILDGKTYVVNNTQNIMTINENDLTEISGALGVTSYTPNCSEGYVTSKVGTDIKSSLKSGHNILVIQTADNLPSPTNSDTINNNTGMGMVLINIMGYMNFET